MLKCSALIRYIQRLGGVFIRPEGNCLDDAEAI